MELLKEFECGCGRVHKALIGEVIIGYGIMEQIPDILEKYNAKKPFIVSDINTYQAAGKELAKVLDNCNIDYSQYIFKSPYLEPDERSVGSAVMHYDSSADIVIGVGSGVINDICKIVSSVADLPYIIIATAPSMDGYASATSSVNRDGLKISLPAKCADVVIGDIEILKNAPEKLLKAGIGDMLAKFVSICEWRISNIITGEYYCEQVAEMVRKALKKCVSNAAGLLNRKDEAVRAVFEGLVLSGIAMNYAGSSRPASGTEHYFSHIWDMRALEFDTPHDYHGIQCALGTYYTVIIYEKLLSITPDRKKALNYVSHFDYEDYSLKLRSFLGRGATEMINLERKEGKYSAKKHSERLNVIIQKWEDIKEVIRQELMPLHELEKLYYLLNLPKTIEELGMEKTIAVQTFKHTKDIRDKYILSRLCFDLGIIDEIMD